MPRPLKVTKGKFKRAYENSTNAQQIAKKLKISVPAVYTYIKRFNLSSKSRVAYKVSDKQIIETLDKAKNLNHAAKHLAMSTSALQQRCYRMGMSLRQPDKSDNKEVVYAMTNDLYAMLINRVAVKYEMDTRKCRYLIDKYMFNFCNDHNLPVASNFTDLKIALCIKNDRRIRKNVNAISDVTGVPGFRVREYLNL